MRKKPPSDAIIKKKIKSWKKEFLDYTYPEYPPSRFIQTITDLYFTGNKNLAKQVINQAWPKHIPGKLKFIAEYNEALSWSQFYKDAEKQFESF